ncbi:MAG: hypothetical protein AB7F50_03120 [Fimbriimonadaceae bacterium]
MRCGAVLVLCAAWVASAAQWIVLDPILNGTHELRGWKVVNGSVVAWNEDFPWTELALPDAAYNQTSESLTATWTAQGTAKLRVRWTGTLPGPREVWAKVTANAGWNRHEGSGPSSGTAGNGIGAPYVPGFNSGSSSGEKWLRFQRVGTDTYEVTITQYAMGSVTGPMSAVTAGRAASVGNVGEVGFEVESLLFSSAVGGLTDWNENFRGTGGSPFPANGILLDADDRLVAYPFLHIKGTQVSAGLTHRVKSPGPTYELTGQLGASPTFPWPLQTLATNSWLTAVHSPESSLPFTVGFDWVQNSEFDADLGAPFGALARGMPDAHPGGGIFGLVFRVFGAPLGEFPTYKRVREVVGRASGATTEYEAADQVSQWLASLADGPDTCAAGLEWALLDSDVEVSGLCDDQAVLMKRCLNLIGVQAEAKKLHACTTWAGLYTLTSRPYTGPPLPTGVLVPSEYLAFRHDCDQVELWEGVCRAADETWATYPLHHEATDELFYIWLRSSGWQQYWYRTTVFRKDGTVYAPATWIGDPVPGPNGS